MLKITIPAREMFDEVKQEFINTKEQTLELETSNIEEENKEQTEQENKQNEEAPGTKSENKILVD